MSLKPKAPTIGYHYKWAMHFGWCRFADTLHRIEAGAKIVWTGCVKQNQQIQIDAPEAWGGEKAEGGVVGAMDVLLGGSAQGANSYLADTFGTPQTGNRNVVSTVFRGGRYGAFVPNPKPMAMLWECIHAMWPGGEAWYPAKAAIPLVGGSAGGGAGTAPYRWAIRHTVAAYVAGSPDGLDWSDELAFTPGAGAEINVGNRIVSIAPNGDTIHTNYTTPGAWVAGQNAGPTAMLSVRSCEIDGQIWVAKGTNGSAYADTVDGEYIQHPDRAWLIAGNADYVVRYAGGPIAFYSDTYKFFRSPDRGVSWIEGAALIPTGEGTATYAYYLDAADASPTRIAFGGRDYVGNTLVYWTDDGGATLNQSTMPAGQVGQVFELRYIGSNEWIALVNGGQAVSGYSYILRSTDNLNSFTTVTTDINGPVTISQLFQGNIAVDRDSGQAVALVQTTEGRAVLNTFNRVAWVVVPVGFGAVNVYLVGPSGSGGVPASCPINAMNPAHMIYDALTGAEMQGEPTGMIDDASFRAAADQLFAEGFGLCTTYDSDQESPWDFIQRICNAAGAATSQSRITGLYYLDLIRDNYDIATLPVITDNDIIEWQEEATVPAEMVNSVAVTWYDVLNKEERTTAPIVALGHVRTSGEVIPQTSVYKEIPFENIALRCAKRDVDGKSKPLRKFSLTVQRKHRFLRPSMPFRLQAPKRGIADMVCRLGQISHGVHLDGRVRMIAVQDIFGLPDTVNIAPITPPVESTDPTAAAVSVAMEAPYMELAGSLTPEQLAALGEEAGYLMTGVSSPLRGQRYGIYSALPAETLERRAFADFAPHATTTAAALPLDTAVGLATQKLPERIEVGDWARWDDEIIRVGGIAGGVLTMGRGCADTVPAAHAAGSAILFMGAWGGTDGREYAVGDVLAVKLPVNSGSTEQPLLDVSALEVEFAQRQFRPYPPGGLMLNGETFYASGAIVVAPPAGGGGGGGGGGGPSSPPGVTPQGTPASTSLGPNGGYPDAAPYFLPPVPSYGTNLLATMGDFDAPGDLSSWRVFGGAPLPADWSVSGDYMRYLGLGSTAALCYPLRYMLPQDNLQYQVNVRATVQTDPGLTIAIGYAFGVHGISGGLPNFRSTTQLVEYPAETTIELSEVVSAGSGLSIVNLLPIVVLGGSDSGPRNARLTAWEYIIEPIVIARTVQVLDHLDFDAGLTGWTRIPALDPSDATITTASGVLAHEPLSAIGSYTHYVCDDPIDLADDVGKMILVQAEVWSNDPSTFFGNPVNGVALGVTTKISGVYKPTPSFGTPYMRGDFTERKALIVQTTNDPGQTWHAVVSLRAAVGYKAKVRDISVSVTDYPVVLP